MVPKYVTVEHDGDAKLTTWSYVDRDNNVVRVSFHPSDDPAVRARQEVDLSQHLDERTQA